MGDLLLSITSLCRKLNVNPERALSDATDKFINRFELVENEVISEGKNIKELEMTELDAIWDKIKKKSDIFCKKNAKNDKKALEIIQSI